MSTLAKIDIPADIKCYLDEIAERLWSRHATVMVGAGFSRNARKAVVAAPNFPNWHDLANHFYRKLHDRPADAETHYLNPLKLADEVQAAFGRPVLDQLLRTHIPDREHEPSELHVRLLELPWVDVFTVNYDTLLERACVKVTSRRYDVVINKEDLVYSSPPRIVKLHGSLPSTRPFVISEEDYRRYPREQAPFVNTVQQALIEKTLCLIGFSGDDPNFLHWIGWVRDNLGKENSPKVFLVGLLSLTAAQRSLLEQRNVVVVDLAQIPTLEDDNARALSEFLSYLVERKPSPFLDWPRGGISPDSSRSRTVEELSAAWREQRKSYPKWVVAPEASRDSLWLSLRMGLRILNAPEPISPPSDVAFLYELNWRMERALVPIPNDLSPNYERIIARYNPYPKLLIGQNEELSPDRQEGSGIDWMVLGTQWLDLNLSVLRFYREEDISDRWTRIDSRLELLTGYLSPEQAARWHYERCLKALFDFDLADLKRQLTAWPANPALPFWEAKRAGILAELGEVSEADRILEESLAAIRQNQHLAPVMSDFTWVSQECHVMNLLYSVKLAQSFAEGHEILGGDARQKFRDRWNELKAFDCDQWKDLQLFDAKLKAPPVVSIARTKEFDIGHETATQHFGSEDGALLGYTFLRYCEEIGLPFVLPRWAIVKGQAQHALERIAPYSPTWAVVTLMRIGDSKLADSFFSRDTLACVNVSRVDMWIDQYIKVLRGAQSIVVKTDPLEGHNIALCIAQVVPEILSRLCVKSSLDRRNEIFALLKELYDDPEPHKYPGTADLTKRLLGSWSAREQCERLHDLLEMPVVNATHPITTSCYPEPLQFIRLNKNQVQEFLVTPIEKTVIASLLVKVTSMNPEERSRASLRLQRLHGCGLLDEEETRAFAAALWEQTGQNGFPANTPFLLSVFLTLPAPAGVNAPAQFKEYINNWSYVGIDANDKTGQIVASTGKYSVVMTGGKIPWCSDIVKATKRGNRGGYIDWSSEEAIVFLDKLIDWWNAGKERMREPDAPAIFGSISGEFRARYRNHVPILAEVIAPRLVIQPQPEAKDRLRDLLEELDKYGMHALWVRAACIPLFPEGREHVFRAIALSLTTSDADRIRDASDAILTLLRMPCVADEPGVQSLLSAIGQQIKWRREVALVTSLEIMRVVVDEMPDRLSQDLVSDVLVGLDALRNESSALAKEPISDIADRLKYRENAAALAYKMYPYFTKQDATVPPVILEWQKICGNSEEFAEIRNQWGD
jgi:hypothetical protein